jgi:ATP-dependent 26S proteasome regulatory subunit
MAELTDGFSGKDLREVCLWAARIACNQIRSKVIAADVVEAIHKVKENKVE